MAGQCRAGTPVSTDEAGAAEGPGEGEMGDDRDPLLPVLNDVVKAWYHGGTDSAIFIPSSSPVPDNDMGAE